MFANDPKLEYELGFVISSQAMLVEQDLAKPSAFLDERRVLAIVGWMPPPEGWFKINVDGAHNDFSRNSACGGIVRDDHGNFVKGFNCNISRRLPLATELKALLYGMKVARNLSLRKVIFESDSLVIVNMISSGFPLSPKFNSQLEEIH